MLLSRFPGPLTQEQLRGFDKHKYNCSSQSIFDNYVLPPFWNQCMRFMPEWLAPNAITLVALCFNLVAASFVVCVDPHLQANYHPYIALAFAMCIFVYHTLDALDGKQARRLGASSPLGEFFDHGCDAINTVVLSLVLFSVVKAGNWWTPNFTWALAVVPQLIFWSSHYKTIFTKQLVFGYFDVTEVNLIAFSLCVCRAIAPHWIDADVSKLLSSFVPNVLPIPSMPFGTFFICYFTPIAGAFMVFGKVMTTLFSSQAKSYHMPWLPLVGPLSVGVMSCPVLFPNMAKCFAEFPIETYLVVAFAFCRFSMQAVLAQMTNHSGIASMCHFLLPVAVAFMPAWAIGSCTGVRAALPIISVQTVAFFFQVTQQCCSYGKIRVFHPDKWQSRS